VRGLVRPGSPREDLLRRLGVELLPGDLRDVHSLEVALRGVTTVVSRPPARRAGSRGQSEHRGPGRAEALVDASRRGGVRRFVYVSVSPASRDHAARPHQARDRGGRAGSGMAWVVVQPSPFMERWLHRRGGIDVTRAGRRYGGPGRAVSYVSVRDAAKVVAAVADQDSGVSRTRVPVAGPDTLSPLNAGAALEGGERPVVSRRPRAGLAGAGDGPPPPAVRLRALLESGHRGAPGRGGDVLATDPFRVGTLA